MQSPSMTVGINYLIPVSQYAKPGADKISDVRLKVGLVESAECVELLTHEKCGKTYSLFLSGKIRAYDNDGKYFQSSEAIETEISELENYNSDMYTKESTPFFEWIDEDGDPVGDLFGEIHLDAAVELESFKLLLAKY